MNGLAEQSPGTITAQVLDATDPRHNAAIKGHGFDTHGLVVRDGGGKVSHAADGHGFSEGQIIRWTKAAQHGG